VNPVFLKFSAAPRAVDLPAGKLQCLPDVPVGNSIPVFNNSSLPILFDQDALPRTDLVAGRTLTFIESFQEMTMSTCDPILIIPNIARHVTVSAFRWVMTNEVHLA